MIRRLGGAVLGVILSLTGSSPVSAQETAPPYLSLYAGLTAPSDSALVASTASRWNLRVTRLDYGTLSFVVRADSMLMSRRELQDSLQAIRRPDGTPAVEVAEFDRSTSIEAMASDDGWVSLPMDLSNSNWIQLPLLAASWGLDTTRSPRAWPMANGSGIRAVVLDTGFDPSHPEFAGRVIACRTFSAAPDCGQISSACKWHGQHVASTVAGATRGVAPGAELYLLNVFELLSGDCISWSSAQYAALRWALDSTDARVANMSIGGSYSGAVDGLIWQWRDAGRLLVAAAGNNGGSTVSFPAASAKGVAVGAVTKTLARSSYSQRGPELMFAAPGDGISGASGSSGFVSKSGTSMASPHIAGMVALVWSAAPALSADSVLALLTVCSRDLSTPGRDVNTGWGMPRADCAVARARGLDPSPLADSAPLRLARGTSGCKTVSALVPWRTGALPAGLSVELSTNSLCLTAADDVAVGTYTIDLIGVP